jgi:hypothetical protein
MCQDLKFHTFSASKKGGSSFRTLLTNCTGLERIVLLDFIHRLVSQKN